MMTNIHNKAENLQYNENNHYYSQEKTSKKKINYREVYSTFSDYRLVEKEEEINKTLEEWANKKLLLISVADDKVSKSALQILKDQGSYGKVWGEIDLQTSGAEDVVNRNDLANLGMEMFYHSSICEETNKIWLCYLHEPAPTSGVYHTSFLEAAFAKQRIRQFEHACETFKKNDCLAILVISDSVSRELFDKVPTEIKEYIHHWQVDFLPTFLHIYFDGDYKPDSEAEANYLLKQLKEQQSKGHWKKNAFEFQKQLMDFLNNEISGKSDLRNYISESQIDLKEKGAEGIRQKQRKNAYQLIWQANPVEKKALYLIACLDRLTVHDFRVLMPTLLQEVKIDDWEEEASQDKQGEWKQKRKKIKIEGEDYFQENATSIFQNCRLGTFTDAYGNKLLKFIDGRFKEHIKDYFEQADPIYYQQTYDQIIQAVISGDLLPPAISHLSFDSLVKFMVDMVMQNPQKYGNYLLEELIKQAKEELDTQTNFKNHLGKSFEEKQISHDNPLSKKEQIAKSGLNPEKDLVNEEKEKSKEAYEKGKKENDRKEKNREKRDKAGGDRKEKAAEKRDKKEKDEEEHDREEKDREKTGKGEHKRKENPFKVAKSQEVKETTFTKQNPKEKNLEAVGGQKQTVVQPGNLATSKKSETPEVEKAKAETEEAYQEIKIHFQTATTNTLLIKLLRVMFTRDSEVLNELAINQCLRPLANPANNEVGPMLLLYLLKNLPNHDQIQIFDYLKTIFNRSNLAPVRQATLEFLFHHVLQNSFQLPVMLKNISAWMPDQEYDQYYQANAKRVSVIFLFAFSDYLLSREKGNASALMPLFEALTDDRMSEQAESRKNMLQDYVRWLFHPKFQMAIGNWIFQHHDQEHWQLRITLGQRGTTSKDKLHFFLEQLHLLLEDKPASILEIFKAVILRECVWIFTHWIIALVGLQPKEASEQNRTLANDLIACLKEELSAKDRKYQRQLVLQELRRISEDSLERAGDLDLTKTERKNYSVQRKFIKYILRQFKQSSTK